MTPGSNPGLLIFCPFRAISFSNYCSVLLIASKIVFADIFVPDLKAGAIPILLL